MIPPNPSSLKFVAAEQLIYTGEPIDFQFSRKKVSAYPSSNQTGQKLTLNEIVNVANQYRENVEAKTQQAVRNINS